MADAWVAGKPVPARTAVAEAARLLRSSRLPVIAGLGTDVEGARAAVVLADRLGATIDHMHSTALLHDLDVLRQFGLMITTPNEARLQADVVLLVGPGLTKAWPDLPNRLLAPRPGDAPERRIWWLCPGGDRIAGPAIRLVGDGSDDVAVELAVLRARVAGRPTRAGRQEEIDTLAENLRGAQFGVAVWSAAQLDALTIEMLSGLVSDLNAGTRFTGLPLAPPDNAWGVQQVSAWMTGFPPPAGFGRGFPEHDPWRFNTTRLINSGEADCALWISAYNEVVPDWTGRIPTVALTTAACRFRRAPHVQIMVGSPGVDHDGTQFCPLTGTLVAVAAKKPSGALSVAALIADIATAIAATET